jgi:hypothetical protein
MLHQEAAARPEFPASVPRAAWDGRLLSIAAGDVASSRLDSQPDGTAARTAGATDDRVRDGSRSAVPPSPPDREDPPGGAGSESAKTVARPDDAAAVETDGSEKEGGPSGPSGPGESGAIAVDEDRLFAQTAPSPFSVDDGRLHPFRIAECITNSEFRFMTSVSLGDGDPCRY